MHAREPSLEPTKHLEPWPHGSREPSGGASPGSDKPSGGADPGPGRQAAIRHQGGLLGA
eukprot:COSAG01_NODE_52281_length_347_cov_6.088710_1_plen_58_part_10